MLIIRYRRVGKKNHAQYKIVVAEKSFPIKGKFVEALGSYDPHNKETVLKEDRIKYWLGVGAQCSDSVYNLLVSNGLIKGEKRKVSIKEKTKEGTEEEAPKEQTSEQTSEQTTSEKPAEENEKGEAVEEKKEPTTKAKEEKAEESKEESKEEESKKEDK